MSQHAWRTNQRAWTTRLVHTKPRVSPPKQAPDPLPSTLPLHNSCFRTTCHEFLINGHISARTKLNELEFPNPFSIAKRKTILQSPVPHAPDSSARIGDCRKAYGKPADVIFFSWPYHYPCIAMAKMIGRADLMSRYDLSQRVHWELRPVRKRLQAQASVVNTRILIYYGLRRNGRS